MGYRPVSANRNIEEHTFSHIFLFFSNERVEGNERQMQWRKERRVNMELVCMLYTVKQILTSSNEPKCSLIIFRIIVWNIDSSLKYFFI